MSWPSCWIGLWAAVLLSSAGCTHQSNLAAPQNTALTQAMQAGKQALDIGRPKQAIEQYRHAYTLAFARDDVQAIGDCGYNIAVVQLADNDAPASLKTVANTRDALSVRANPGFPELDLIEASALLRLGRLPQADRLAQRAQVRATDSATAERASYVRGRVAERRGDAAALELSLKGFVEPNPQPSVEADRAELQARLEYLRGHFPQAASLAEQAADIQQVQLNYQAMAEALAVAAKAQQSAGHSQEAGNLYLQAGESAAARGDVVSARQWLRQAADSRVASSTRRAAQNALSAMPKTQ
jgi:hypothetical protein